MYSSGYSDRRCEPQFGHHLAYLMRSSAARSGLILEGQGQARSHLKSNVPWSHKWGPVQSGNGANGRGEGFGLESQQHDRPESRRIVLKNSNSHIDHNSGDRWRPDDSYAAAKSTNGPRSGRGRLPLHRCMATVERLRRRQAAGLCVQRRRRFINGSSNQADHDRDRREGGRCRSASTTGSARWGSSPVRTSLRIPATSA